VSRVGGRGGETSSVQTCHLRLPARHFPFRLEPAGKRVLLQVVEPWLGQVTVDGLPAGVWELRNELQNDLAGGELDDA
jgi:hypothetical protein